MKKTTLFLVVILAACNCIGQEIQKNANETIDKQEFLRLSKSQKTTGWIMIGGGAASFITGTAIMLNDVSKAAHTIWPNPEPQPLEESNGIGPSLVAIGATAIIAGGFFLGASKKNKKRAMSISLMNETIPGRRPQGLASPSMPVASLSIRF